MLISLFSFEQAENSTSEHLLQVFLHVENSVVIIVIVIILILIIIIDDVGIVCRLLSSK